ncbi:MAG: hypothetical protein ACR2K4_06625 [Candidatus Limnocylindria bacterium]
MTHARWLWLVAVVSVVLLAISFVNGWIFHDREVRGEGYREVHVYLSAWRGVAMPVTTIAALGALAIGLGAAAAALGRRVVPPWLLIVGAAVVIGLIAASAVPVTKVGHASTVRLSAAWLLPVALAMAVVMAFGLRAALQPSRRVVVAALALGAVVLAGGAGARWLGLQWAEGTGRHWEVGSYTRPATNGEQTETLSLTGDRYAVDDRWSGDFESSGWTVIVDNDPACPEARGTYHAHGENEEDLRFVMVVDPCLGGERAADFETGIWKRDP